MFSDSVKYKNKAKGVQDFLTKNKIKEVEEDRQGTSWLELYTLYKMDGGECMVDDTTDKGAPRPAMRTQIKAFVKTCRDIARLTMESEDAKLFQCNKAKWPRLKRLGISTHVPMVRFHIVINKDTAIEMTKHILSSQARRNKKQLEDIAKRNANQSVQIFSHQQARVE